VATVNLTAPAPADSATITLASDSAAATVPPSVTVNAGATSATFQITTFPGASVTSATISASYLSETKSTQISVNPPSLSTLTLSPSTVSGGASSTGIVTLNGLAPANGQLVTLASSDQ